MRKDLRNVLITFGLVLATALGGGIVYGSTSQQSPLVDATANATQQPAVAQQPPQDAGSVVLIGTTSSQTGNPTQAKTSSPSSSRKSSPSGTTQPTTQPAVVNKTQTPVTQTTQTTTTVRPTTPPPAPAPQPVVVQPDPVPVQTVDTTPQPTYTFFGGGSRRSSAS